MYTVRAFHSLTKQSCPKEGKGAAKTGNMFTEWLYWSEEKMFSRSIYKSKFQGNCKKICNNFSKFGVPTPSKCGCQLLRTAPLKVHVSPVTGSQPRVLEEKFSCRIILVQKYKCLRIKATSTYHHHTLFSVIKPCKWRNDSPQPGLLPLVISLNASKKSGL